jgi:hypothetical protein
MFHLLEYKERDWSFAIVTSFCENQIKVHETKKI